MKVDQMENYQLDYLMAKIKFGTRYDISINDVNEVIVGGRKYSPITHHRDFNIIQALDEIKISAIVDYYVDEISFRRECCIRCIKKIYGMDVEI